MALDEEEKKELVELHDVKDDTIPKAIKRVTISSIDNIHVFE